MGRQPALRIPTASTPNLPFASTDPTDDARVHREPASSGRWASGFAIVIREHHSLPVSRHRYSIEVPYADP